MPLARCQAVADTREIIEIKFDLDHHKLHNKQKPTKIWTVDFLNLKNLGSTGTRTARFLLAGACVNA